jgi:predicted DNA binding protein
VLAELGETIGYAYASMRRKRALTSETVLEVTFRSRTIPEGTPHAGLKGRNVVAELNHISYDAGHYLVYSRVSGMDPAEFAAEFQKSPLVESVRILDGDDDSGLLEVRQTEAPMTNLLSKYGGRIEHGHIEDGTLTIVVTLPQETDVRDVLGELRNVLPHIELVSHRSVVREHGKVIEQSVFAPLTEKQRTALEAAYYAGYYNWPRRQSTAAEVAAGLGISPTTFKQHLRIAEEKTLRALLDGEES